MDIKTATTISLEIINDISQRNGFDLDGINDDPEIMGDIQGSIIEIILKHSNQETN